jgi:hypothetical protein
MAFALSKFKAYGLKTQGPTRVLGQQVVELHITAANTDTDLDIGDNSGTFWSAADNTDLGAEALRVLREIIADKVQGLLAVNSEELVGRLRDTTATGAGVYALAVANNRPNISWFSGDAPTSYVVQLVYQLLDSQFPTFVELG